MENYFDRQVRIENWDQSLYLSMKVLCLGVGGLGSVVSMNLCRLGVGHIILVDHDVVDIHNLNRQLLFKKSDIGLAKVDCAKKALESTHNLVSVIEAHQLDIISEWEKIVQLAEGTSAIFNMIDYGDSFDLAAQSLCKALKIPLIQGGTFSQTVTVEFFPSDWNNCLACGIDSVPEFLNEIRPKNIKNLKNLEFLPKNRNPVGLSNCYLCGICGMMMVAKFGEYLLRNEGVQISNRSIFYVNSMEAVNFMVERKENCLICSDLVNG
jgi:molybdopterin/thiamine biosynthesis adenylyltransferase